jgi:hypothetical protein
MRNLLLPILVFLFSCDTTNNLGVSDGSYFLKYFGDDGNQQGVDLEVDSEGNIYLLGSSETGSSDNPERDLILVKADSRGNLIWQKTFGTPKVDNARDLLITKENNIVVLANTAASFSAANVDSDVFIAVLDKEGELQRTKTFDFGKGTNEIGYSISQTTDGFIVAGSTTFIEPKVISDGVLGTDITDGLQVRFFADLTLYPSIWRQKNGTEFSDVIVSIVQSEKGDFSLFGYSNKKLTTTSDLNYKYWVRNLNSNGEAPRGELFIEGKGDNGQNAGNLILDAVVQVSDGFLLAGQFNNNSTSTIYVSKVSNLLTLNNSSWVSNLDLKIPLPSLNDPIRNFAIASTPNEDFYVASNQLPTIDNSNWLLTSFSRNGGKDWTNPVLFGGEYDDKIGAVKILGDGKILLVGTMAIGSRGKELKMTLVKVNSSGRFAN